MTQPQVKLIGQRAGMSFTSTLGGPIMGGSSFSIGNLNFCEEFGK